MDPSWCPGCDRLILPKRYVVPVNSNNNSPRISSTPSPPPPPPPASPDDPNHPPPPPAPTPVPSSPEVRKKPLPGPPRNPPPRSRFGGGLVHGTGRVRPGGGLKPAPATDPRPKKPTISPPKPPRAPTDVLPGNPTAARLTPPPSSQSTPSSTPSNPGKKTRVVISQLPTPLYCSDECRARDLKNSFLDSESLSFGGAAVAVDQVEQIERVERTVEHVMQIRKQLGSSKTLAAAFASARAFPLVPSPVQQLAEVASLPSAPLAANNDLAPLVESPTQEDLPPHASRSTVSSASSSSLPPSDSKTSTIRASSSRPRARPALANLTTSFSTWGSPSKGALAPPRRTLFTASSSMSSSVDSSTTSLSAGSALFDEEGKLGSFQDGDETSATTPSRRGSGSSSGTSKKEKRVSFASDSKPPSPMKSSYEDWRSGRKRRNPLLDANPLRDAISVTPKDRVKPASMPHADLLPPQSPLRATQSSPSLVVDSPSTSRYAVAMWPEDEKRTTESARVHGQLLRNYAKRFAPREGRSLVWSRLWEEDESLRKKKVAAPSPSVHEAQPDSRREYWRAFEEREAEARARKRAAAVVEREEEEKVIYKLLGGNGMREEDQPQARRMKQMAYDGMPGPAEQRGLTYKFDQFLYPLMKPKPVVVEKTVRRWDEARQEWIEEITREEVYQEPKKLFNFVEDY